MRFACQATTIEWGDLCVNKCYNNSGGEFKIEITDDNSLYNWAITPTYKEKQTDTGEIYTAKKGSGTCKNEQNKITYSVDTSTLKSGWYTFDISATDNAMNTLNAKSVATFYVDHENLAGSVEITNVPSSAETKYQGIHGKQNWIKKSSNELTLKVNVDTERSSIKRYEVEINGTVKSGSTTLKEVNENKYFTVPFNPNEILPNNEQEYRIKASIETDTGNRFTTEEYVIHVDQEIPVIKSISVQKKSTPLEDILNILSFGLFAKDRYILAIDADDVNQYESGIAKVQIFFTKYEKSYELTYDGEKYILDLSTIDETLFNDGVFESIFTVTVTDNVGKSSSTMPDKVIMAEMEKEFSPFLMLENNPPIIKVELPTADSLNRTDGEYWYRKHISTEPNAETVDAEKYITVLVSDANSGIRKVDMYKNEKLKHGEYVECMFKDCPALQIVKQVVAMFCSLLTYSEVKRLGFDKLLLEKERNTIDRELFDLRIYITSPETGQLMCPPASIIYKQGESFKVGRVADLAVYPFGFILNLTPEIPVEYGTSIMKMFDAKYNDKCCFKLPMIYLERSCTDFPLPLLFKEMPNT